MAVSLALTGRLGLSVVGFFALLGFGGTMAGGGPDFGRRGDWRLDPVDVTRPQRAAANDLLDLVPVRPERGIGRLWATHPRLTTRVRELGRPEERLQAR